LEVGGSTTLAVVVVVVVVVAVDVAVTYPWILILFGFRLGFQRDLRDVRSFWLVKLYVLFFRLYTVTQ